MTLRVVATVAVDTLTLPKLKPGGQKNPKDAVLHTRRTVFDDGVSLDTPRYQRDKLLADDIVEGPALIIQHELDDARSVEMDRAGDRAWRHPDLEDRGDALMAEVDPITLQVIGGALHSIAEQMGNVLYRMSYSSIIRESQDLGAGLFDRDYNTLCDSELDPDAHRFACGISARYREDSSARRMEARRLRHPQSPLFRRQPFAPTSVS